MVEFASSAAEPRGRARWWVLFGAWLTSVAANVYVVAPASVLSVAMADLSITSGAGSWIFSAAFAGWCLTNVPAGMALDRWDEVRVVGVAAVLLCAGGLWGWRAGATGAYFQLLASRFVAGIAVGVVWTGGASIVGAAFPAGERASAAAVFTTSSPVGLAIGQFLTPLFVGGPGWPVALGAYGVLTVATFAVLAWTTRHRELDGSSGGTSATPGRYREILTDRAVWSVCLMAFVSYSLYAFFNGWIPTYLVERFRFSVAEGGLFAALFALAGVLSRTVGGYLSDGLFDGRRRPPIVTSLVASLVVTVAVGALADPSLVVVLLFPAGLAIQLCVGVYYAYVTELVAPEETGVALGVLGTVGIAGSFSGPLVAGFVIEATSGYAPAFAYAAVLAALGAVLAWRTPEPDPRSG